MHEPIISVSGLRGLIGSQLHPGVAVRYASALAATLPAAPQSARRVVVGRDGRSSGSMLFQAIASTLQAHGLDVIDLGVAATPTVGVQVRQHQAVAGIQISASHNPPQYNGMKLFNSQGRVLPKAEGEQVLTAYREARSAWATVDALGGLQVDPSPHAAHAQAILASVDVDQIRSRRFRVLLDSNHGAGSLLGQPLLAALGCHVTLMGETPDGRFAHPPEPVAENLQQVAQHVQAGGFDVGFCQDPDADRLAVIAETGHYIGEEFTLALCLMQALPHLARPGGVVVTNCATSSLSRTLADQYGCQLKQSAVGEANVADLMIAEQALFGGEGNGGPIDPQIGYVRDSFVGMARILDLLASRQAPLSQLVASLPPLALVKDKAELPPALLPRLYDALLEQLTDATPNRQDGLKLQWPDRWLLVRGSNTEPIVRFMAEAPSQAEAQQLCETARNVAMHLES